MSLPAFTSKIYLDCFICFKQSKIFLLYFCFMLINYLKDSIIYAHGYFECSGSCIKTFIHFNISMSLSCILISYSTFLSINFWGCLLQNSQMTVYDLQIFFLNSMNIFIELAILLKVQNNLSASIFLYASKVFVDCFNSFFSRLGLSYFPITDINFYSFPCPVCSIYFLLK